jgi:hypothetical protein
MASDDDADRDIIYDHNLVHSPHISGPSSIRNIINGTEDEFDTIKISGDLQVEGKIKAKQFELDETQIILNIDYDKITEYMKNMDSLELKVFMKHLEKLKFMSEKELFNRS